MPTALTWLRAAAAVAAIATQVAAQTCYYPNGKKAADSEKPCSSAEGSACCPDKWQCLDNGMCHYEPDNIYGRYSCTDQSWDSPGCPSNLCTYSMTGAGAQGAENMQQCSDHNNDWCCNANGVDVHCCQESPSPRPFFALQDGKAYATIGSNTASTAPDLASITGLATSGGSGGGGGGSGSQTSALASSDAPSSTAGSSANTATADSISTTAKPFTSTKTSITSDATGGIQTITVPVTVTPTANDPSNTAGAASGSSSGTSSKLGVIIGCAVGIPLALALVGIIFWLLRKRRNQKANPYKESPEMEGGKSAFVGGASGKLGKKQTYRNSHPGTTEIDGNPVGAGQRISAVKNHAELPSGNDFRPGQGTPYAPDAVGIGGGNGRETWGSVPPQYSPAHNQTAFSHQHPEAAELDATGVLPIVNEKAEGQQQYIPYRPPQPVAEMPTVTTPPEDVERQMHHR